MPFFICPNCKERSVDLDGYDGFSTQALQCRSCAFGFLYELLEDYYPAPETGFVVCDRNARVLAAGRGVFELTGYRDADHLSTFSISQNTRCVAFVQRAQTISARPGVAACMR